MDLIKLSPVESEIRSSKIIDILLVDDRIDNLLTLEAVLEKPEYRLIKAKSGEEALKFLMESEPALILLDVQMPGLDGFETASIIKQSARTREIPIIFLTAISKDEHYVQKGYEYGAVDYLYKPFDTTVLQAKVAVFAELFLKTRRLVEMERTLRESERKHRERRIAELEITSLRREQAQQRRYLELVEGIRNGIVWTAKTRNFTFSFVGPSVQHILGYLADDCLNEKMTCLDWIYSSDKDLFQEMISKLSSQANSIEVEHRVISKSGKVLWFKTNMHIGQCLETQESEIRGLSVDVTKLKETEETLRASILAREEFLSIASHELKTPLASLKLQTQLTKRNAEKGDPKTFTLDAVNRLLDQTDRSVSRLTRLVEDMLDVSHFQTGRLTIRTETCDLVSIVQDVAERMKHQMQEAGTHLEVQIDSHSLRGKWDRLRMEQVLFNLLTNAVRYGNRKPVELRIQTKGPKALISVQDQGIGIDPADQDRIFERFERGASAVNGLGLGLFIAKQIVIAHGGKIWVESAGEGQGCTFFVELPANTEAPEAL